MVDRKARKHLLDAIGQLSEAKGWLSSSAPADRDYPTGRIMQAVAHINAAMNGDREAKDAAQAASLREELGVQ